MVHSGHQRYGAALRSEFIVVIASVEDVAVDAPASCP